jgi:TonB dependent receptor-like, beta-barrel/CarboxypepD_reg-like domain/TonB-dependent Receptor Plug Domain
MKSGLFFLLIIYSSLTFAQTGKLIGKVTDGNSPIPSVNVIIVGTRLGTATDDDGKYRIENIPAGEHQVKFSSLGYSTRLQTVTIKSGTALELNITMLEKVIEIDPVEVTGSLGQDQRDTRTSLIDLNPRDAKILPGAVEDVFRTLQSLPGVLAPNDFSSQLVIRGSGPDQNLIILDDVEVFNPYRLYGVVSMFNPDAVENVSLISGGFPAKYGDRLSAVLDVTNKEGTTTQNLKGSLNASIVDANLILEGRNPFNLKGSWLVNSRRTYYDLVIEPFVKNSGLVDENTSFPNFYDVQGKIVIGPYDGNKFLFNGILSRDGVNVVSGSNRKTPDSAAVFNITKNDLVSAAWHYAPNSKLLNKVIVSWYKNNGTTDFDSEILDPSLNRNNFENTVPDTLAPYLLGFKFNGVFSYTKYAVDDKFTYNFGDHILEAGAGADFMQSRMDFEFQLDPGLQAIFSRNPQFRAALSDLKDIQNYNRYRVYADDNFKVTDRFTIQPSLRLDYYNILNKGYIAPRFSASYAIDELTTIRANWGIYYQSPGYEKLRDQGVLYDFSNENVKDLQAEKAIHYVIGIDHWLSSEWNVKLESYYKDFSDLYVQKIVQGSNYVTEPIPGGNPKSVSGWTQPAITQGDSATQIPLNGSYGESYGLEFLLAKKNIIQQNKLSGWISYSLAYTDRIEGDRKFPFRFDQRHTVNLVLQCEINNWLDVGFRWQYGSGFPYTQPVGVKPRIILEDQDLDGKPETPVIATRNTSGDPNADGEVIFDIDFGDKKLNTRKPEYHRLDVRLNAKADWWNLEWVIYLDVINVYNHSNTLGYDYYVNEDLTLGREKTTMLPIIPTLGFSVKF